jgi:hypothetical protein
LSGDEAEVGDSVHLKFEVRGELGEWSGAKNAGVESFELGHPYIWMILRERRTRFGAEMIDPND